LFLEQLKKHPRFQTVDERDEIDEKLLEVFRRLKSIEPEYPPAMLARRRSLYKQRISKIFPNTIWHVLRSRFQDLIAGLLTFGSPIPVKFARAATLAVGIAMVAFAAFALYGKPVQTNSPAIPPTQVFTMTPGQVSDTPPAAIICADGDEPPLCIAVELDKSQNVAYTGNGSARPAVAKDSSKDDMTSAAHLNDGLYGPSASWVSESPNSWIKIDLGAPTAIDTVAFGRDRHGKLNAGDPGRFVIAVATFDDVYADGNSSNDEREYVQVFDSQQEGFDGTISGGETVVAVFELRQARFIKITFQNARTVIDEVEAFASRSTSVVSVNPTRTRDSGSPSNPSTALPANTTIPSSTATPVPVNTMPPTATITSVPTMTAAPTMTAVPTDPLPTVETPVPATPTQPPPTLPPVSDTPESASSDVSTAMPTQPSSASDG
jgi:hypothetical protein